MLAYLVKHFKRAHCFLTQRVKYEILYRAFRVVNYARLPSLDSGLETNEDLRSSYDINVGEYFTI